jgi:hypothetical protein
LPDQAEQAAHARILQRARQETVRKGFASRILDLR